MAFLISTIRPRRSSTTAFFLPGAAKEAAASDWSAESPAFSHSSTSEESMERTSTRSQEMMSSSCSSRFSGGTVRASVR